MAKVVGFFFDKSHLWLSLKATLLQVSLWFPCCCCGSVLLAGMLPAAGFPFQSTAVPLRVLFCRASPPSMLCGEFVPMCRGLKSHSFAFLNFSWQTFIFNTKSPVRRKACSSKSSWRGPRSPLVLHLCSGSTLLSHWTWQTVTSLRWVMLDTA